LFYDKKSIITVEEHSLACGFGSAVLELAAKKSFENKTRFSPDNMGKIVTLGGPDEFIKVGSRGIQLDEVGVSAARIVKAVKTIVSE
jgi:1-deoxy-D-xylulose-5-phosphate synthase